MNRKQWSKRVTKAEAIRRAGGRNRYNAERRQAQTRRRCVLVRLLSLKGDLAHGDQQQLAERFGVHKSVISKDCKWAREMCGGMIGSGLLPRIILRGSSVGFEWVFRG
ncbi:MAG: hypothetical protein ABI977_12575 [Acidobacteriota bacterium]